VHTLSVNRDSAYLWRTLTTLMLRRGRQLQHNSGLAGDQPSDLHNLAVRKFKRVVMNVRIVHINLPKSCDPVIYTRLSEQAQGAVVLDVIVKHQLRAGKEADGHLGFANAGEAAGDRFRKIRRYQLIPDLSGARGNEMKTVIAQGYRIIEEGYGTFPDDAKPYQAIGAPQPGCGLCRRLYRRLGRGVGAHKRCGRTRPLPQRENEYRNGLLFACKLIAFKQVKFPR
jgi:hypothetical protein